MNGAIEKKIEEFYHNALLSDLDVTAYGYRPVQNLALKEKLKLYTQSLPHIVKINTEKTLNSNKSDEFESEVNGSFRFCKQAKLRKTSKLDDNMDLNLMSKEEIFEEATKSQTFLCAASFVYPPKPVIFTSKLEHDRFCRGFSTCWNPICLLFICSRTRK
jgi:hypothetical protein